MTWPEFFRWLIENHGWEIVLVPLVWIFAIRVES